MKFSKRIVLISTALMFHFTILSQEHRYFVFFKDKSDSPYSLSQPQAYLSDLAIQRRQKQGIQITSTDLPVNPAYLAQINATGGQAFYSSRWFNGAIVQMDSLELQKVQSLSFVDSIAWIAKNAKLTSERSVFQLNDSFENSPYSTASSDLQLGMINALKMHEDGYTGADMIIAILDGGFIGAPLFKPFEHVFSSGQYLGGEDLVTYGDNPFRYSGHGTAVWSTIAAKSDSLTGTAYEANFLVYVTEDVGSESPIEEYNWLIAAEKADSAGADIIQSSVGYSVFNSPFSNYSYQDLDGKSTVITKAANLAFDRGMIVVTSAGNEGNSSWRFVTAPADSKNVLAVGSITDEYTKSSFSSIGPTPDGRIKPDVVALGSRTTLMAGNGAIQQSSGTSYAAPLIAGLAAGIWQANPNWTNQDVIQAIKMTASRALNPDNHYGYGVPNYQQAVLGSVLNVSDILSEKIKVYPNPFRNQKVFIDLSNQVIRDTLEIKVFDLKGKLISETTVAPNTREIVEMQVDTSAQGVYLMTLMSPTFFKEVKLIKE